VMPTAEWEALARLHPEATITALSEYQWSDTEVRPAAVIPHAVDEEAFTLRRTADDYLAYLGRFTPGKGVVQAIDCARDLDLPLRLAGWPNDYFDAEIAPLVDGERVRFVGPVAGAARDDFLGRARALLYPITAPEPFGLVLLEAMACGTPVAAFAIGAVAEIVDEGVTGSTCPVGDHLGEAVRRAVELDRPTVANQARQRFGSAAMAGSYERLFERVLVAAPPGSASPARSASVPKPVATPAG
jgi:glycosyltransferase involved in cell wall biosynthesis